MKHSFECLMLLLKRDIWDQSWRNFMIIALFWFFLFALQCNLTWMRDNFGLKLQNSPKLPHIHARLHCNANEKN